MNIGIIYGSKSVEHEISIITALQVFKKIKNKFNVKLIYLSKDLKFYVGKELENIESYKNQNKLLKKLKQINILEGGRINKQEIDVFLPLIHGSYGEDGNIYAYLNMLNCKYIGSSLSSHVIAQDKSLMKIFLKYHNINQIDFKIIKKDEFFLKKDDILKELKEIGYPFIVKPSNLGSSVGIDKINEDNALDSIIEAFKYDDKIVIEKFISNFKEINQSVYLGNKIKLSKLERVDVSDSYLTFKDKYDSFTKFNMYERFNLDLKDETIYKINQLSKQLYKLLELKNLIRIDYIIKEDEIFVNEINCVPGSFSHYLWDKPIYEIIYELIKSNTKKNSLIYSNKINILNTLGFKNK